MHQPSMTSQAQVRAAFWQGWTPELKRAATVADIRCEFVDFVDMLARDGHITEALAARVTLGGKYDQ